jgi:hypothetical protein
MSRKSMAVLVSLALVLGSISTGASAQTAPTKPDQPAVTTTNTAKNESPLPPGGPAGLQQAQGSNSTLWIVGGILIGGAILAIALASSGSSSTPSTN